MKTFFKFLYDNKVFLVYVPLVLYWMLILFLTSLPSKSLPQVGLSDKVDHLLAFFGLGVLLYLTLKFQDKFANLKKYAEAATILIASFYAFLDELHQLFVPGRSTEFLDWLADFGGCLIGVLVTRYLITKYLYNSGTFSFKSSKNT